MNILAADIEKEHSRAELQRLREGQDGCGCNLCQRFYTALDLKKYGERVKWYGNYISIIAGITGADLLNTNTDRWRGGIFVTGGKAYGLTSDLLTICLGYESEVKEIGEAKENGKGNEENRPVDSKRFKRTSSKRTRPADQPEHKPFNTRQFKARQKFSVRPSQQPGQVLFGIVGN